MSKRKSRRRKNIKNKNVRGNIGMEKTMNAGDKMDELRVTTFEDLKQYSKGTIVRLPDFADKQPFVARIIRPSMLQMVKDGLIPNPLLSKANGLFFGGKDVIDMEDEEIMSQIFGIIDVICEASFIEPTYKQIKESGVKLTDEQMMFIFNYSQRGVNALGSFR